MLIAIFLKGIIIGLSTSMPLGPIGMLAIQRTLNRGQKHGLATGLGGAASDLVYAVITLFFVSFVIDIIDQHRFVIQLIGSIIVVLFGIWIFRSNPIAQPLPHEKPIEHSIMNDFITSFGLTLSNPLIIFVLIALFSHLNFVSLETSIFGHILGLTGIFIGAMGWWTLLTSFSSKFRDRFNIRGLKIINRITGTVIMVLGIFGTVISLIK
ncbi:MAG: LysE family translocator [Paludibacteraceae bacterium]